MDDKDELEATMPLINKVQKLMDKEGVDYLNLIKYADSDNVSVFFDFESNPKKAQEAWECILDAALQFFVSSSSLELEIAVLDANTKDLVHLYTREDASGEYFGED